MPLYFEIAAGCVLAIFITLILYFIKSKRKLFFKYLKCFKSSDLFVVEEIKINAINSYDLSLKNVEIALENELEYPSKIKILTNKIEISEEEEKMSLELLLEYLNIFYENRKNLSKLSRDILSHNLKIKEIVIKFLSRLSLDDIKQVEFDEFLKIASIPEKLNNLFKEINLKIEESNIIINELSSKNKINLNIFNKTKLDTNSIIFEIINDIKLKIEEINLLMETSLEKQNIILTFNEIDIEVEL